MKTLFSKSLSRKQLTMLGTSLIVCAATSGALYYKETEKNVVLTFNGHRNVVKTHANTVKDLLSELHLGIRSQDYLFPRKNTKLTSNLTVVWKQAKRVQIVNGNEEKTVWTTADTVGKLLEQVDVKLNQHDQISPSIGEKIKSRMKIKINRAFPITFVDGGIRQQTWSTSTTVADFLTNQGIELQALDRVEPSLSAEVKENDTIHVIRVEKVTDVVEEPIQFSVITKKDSSLAKGTQKVVTSGKNGLLSKQFEVVLEDGKEISRRLINQSRIREKQDKIVAVGTRAISYKSNSGEPSGGRELFVNTTAYTADCNGCSGRTSTGINLFANPNAKVIAVDPRVIPLGSKVYVEGYGYAIAADTGGSIKGLKIDVFFSSKSEAYRWGVRKVRIRVLP